MVVNALACAVTVIPEVVVRAWLFDTVTAASGHVPVETLSALVSEATAFTVFSVLIDEPVPSALALLFDAFPSAVSGIPVLTL